MRPRRLLPLPLALLLGLVTAGPAMAIDWSVAVTPEFTFAPPERKIAVGDTVTWTFADGGHTTVARRGQAESWDSEPGPGETNGRGDTFRHNFDKPGRFQYVCDPHTYMKGVIQVGEDEEADAVDNLKTGRRGRTMTLGFTLNEPATVTYKLRGPTSRTVRRGRLKAGRQSVKVRRLRAGAYRGTLMLVDDFDKKVTPKNSFVIR